MRCHCGYEATNHRTMIDHLAAEHGSVLSPTMQQVVMGKSMDGVSSSSSFTSDTGNVTRSNTTSKTTDKEREHVG